MTAVLVGAAAVLLLAGAVRQAEHATPPAAGLSDARMPVDPAARPQFTYIDIYLDSGATPLAAYQLELTALDAAGLPLPAGSETGGDPAAAYSAEHFAIVGIEGGEHPAFVEPPYYDPAALAGGRIVLAAFDTGTDLPAGRTRVARVHVMQQSGTPEYGVKLIVAAGADGNELTAQASVELEGGL